MPVFREVVDSSLEAAKAEIAKIRAALPHAGEKGADVEGIFLDIFRSVLPKKIGVTSGFVIDSSDQISRQLDLIFYDQLNCPILYSSGRNRVIPVEATYVAAEIKLYTNSDQFIDCIEKSKSYKSLVRNAYIPENLPYNVNYNLFGYESANWESIFFAISFDSISAERLLDVYVDYYKNSPAHFSRRLDSFFSLSGPCLINSRGGFVDGIPADGSVNLLPNENSKIGSYNSNSPLALMLNLIFMYAVQAPTTRVNLAAYNWGGPF